MLIKYRIEVTYLIDDTVELDVIITTFRSATIFSDGRGYVRYDHGMISYRNVQRIVTTILTGDDANVSSSRVKVP